MLEDVPDGGLIGIDDAVPALGETFSQWVLEDDFRPGRPPFEKVGVEMRDDAGRAVWRVEQPRYERAVLSVAGTHRSGWGTEHAISAQGAIVIDVTVSGADAVAGRAETVVQHIAQRFSQ